MIGTVLSGYQIIEKVKDGSVGAVWKARNAFNQDVALKVMSRQNAAVSKKLREFQHEATVAADLQHPFIIKVIKYVDARPQPYLIMEYFNSENLKYAMWYLPERVAGREFKILRVTCEALGAVHAQGYVHLDVKPENVLVSPVSDIRLIDFSIAVRWNRRFGLGKKAYGGTPLYMAPEQIRGEKVSPAADQYALGAMAFELFTKKPPFLGVNPNAILEKHLKQPPPSLRTYLKGAPPDMDAWVLRMLAKDPKERFDDMAAVGSELARLEKKVGTGWPALSADKAGLSAEPAARTGREARAGVAAKPSDARASGPSGTPGGGRPAAPAPRSAAAAPSKPPPATPKSVPAPADSNDLDLPLIS